MNNLASAGSGSFLQGQVRTHRFPSVVVDDREKHGQGSDCISVRRQHLEADATHSGCGNLDELIEQTHPLCDVTCAFQVDDLRMGREIERKIERERERERERARERERERKEKKRKDNEESRRQDGLIKL